MTSQASEASAQPGTASASASERVTPDVVDPADEHAPRPEGEAVAGEGDSKDASEQVSKPTKLIRIASMVRSMLDEVRRAPLDEDGRRRLREIHERSLVELEDILSDDLQTELSEVALPFGAETPSESELRIAQAQLVGWLEGLFHGIQATLFTQQMQAQQAFEQMRGQKALEMGQQPGQRPPGAYL